jgi:hypothetical protein
MMSANPWYVAVGETTAGPAPTELVVKGIEHRKVPPEAMVCEAGARSWVPLSSVAAFHAAVVRSYPPPPPDSEEARFWMQHGYHFPPPAALPRFDDVFAFEPQAAKPAADPPAAPFPRAPSACSIPDIDVVLEADAPEADALEVDVVEDAPAVDWTDPFESYFMVGDVVELPEEEALLESLRAASPETFRHEEALWNLALCLAYGSDALGAAAAQAFFAAAADHGGSDRIEWMRRTLQSDGFVPSGIPLPAGRRAYQRLRSSCPPSLQIYSAKLS